MINNRVFHRTISKYFNVNVPKLSEDTQIFTGKPRETKPRYVFSLHDRKKLVLTKKNVLFLGVPENFLMKERLEFLIYCPAWEVEKVATVSMWGALATGRLAKYPHLNMCSWSDAAKFLRTIV